MKTCFLLFQCLLIPLFSFSFTAAFAADDTRQTPALILANIYQQGIRLGDYWVSEKFDGVRAYWDGKHLISRQGNIFHAPKWFTAPLSDTPLDGELWSGRGEFEKLSGIVRRVSSDDTGWHDVSFMVFDLPDNSQAFNERLTQLEKIIRDINVPHIQLVKQIRIATHEALMDKLDDIVLNGGEGLMLHSGTSMYKSGRSDDLLKLKKYQDAEAIVISHLPGKGKYTGMLGAMIVETIDKKRFKIGTGFSDAERKNPPAIGSIITYKYFGLTNNGIPRFASFLRKRIMQ